MNRKTKGSLQSTDEKEEGEEESSFNQAASDRCAP